MTANETIAHLNAILGTDMRPTYAPPRAGDVKHSSADISLARKVLVFEPVMSFKDGLAGTVEWYRKR